MTPRSTDKAPRKFKLKAKNQKKGLILVFTGGGKGKTTAALGTAMRAMGQGMSVAMVQFIKGAWKTGELKSAKKFGKKFDVFTMGEGFTWNTQNFDRDVATAQKAWKKCCQLMHDKKHQLIILDEINYCMAYGFLKPKEVIKQLMKKPANKHVILTGNKAPKAILHISDLVTEMRSQKHPYDRGIVAQAGIDF